MKDKLLIEIIHGYNEENLIHFYIKKFNYICKKYFEVLNETMELKLKFSFIINMKDLY